MTQKGKMISLKTMSHFVSITKSHIQQEDQASSDEFSIAAEDSEKEGMSHYCIKSF